ncbi:hypothetical protein IFM89_034584 [Coptis chinensis]|uniref:Uncharacterized protein n=1 Tax=Coptis chinensis TaxID=261450 RepID=A0A835LXP3_9MAGN|nr:hypothetical protein IFM89_034584 [Coptis chinensis]
MPRQKGPYGYERGYGQDQNYFHGDFSIPRGTIVNSRSAPSYNEMWKNRNYRAQERKPNTLFSPSQQQMPVQYVGQPPRPPTALIDKPAYETPGITLDQGRTQSSVGFLMAMVPTDHMVAKKVRDSLPLKLGSIGI